MTISEGLTLMATLRKRHQDLVELRGENSNKHHRYSGEKDIIVYEPTYSVKDVDKKINLVAKEIRLLDMAIKTANANTQITYTENSSVFDVVE